MNSLMNFLLKPTQHNHRVFYYHALSNRQLAYYPLNPAFPRGSLEIQIQELLKLGYKFISLSSAVEAIRAGEQLTKTISLTFDDNFSCLYEHLLPLVRKFKLNPTLFITTKTLDNQAFAWNHKFLLMKTVTKPEIFNETVRQAVFQSGGNLNSDIISDIIQSVKMSKKDIFADAVWKAVMPYSQADYLAEHKPFLSSEQIMDMIAAGCEIGSHSHSHPDFNKLSYQDSYEELQVSWQHLSKFPLPGIRLFAYPYGKRCMPEIEAKLASELDIAAICGSRFSLKDNKSDTFKWERELMELSNNITIKDFAISPILRHFKDRLHST